VFFFFFVLLFVFFCHAQIAPPSARRAHARTMSPATIIPRPSDCASDILKLGSQIRKAVRVPHRPFLPRAAPRCQHRAAPSSPGSSMAAALLDEAAAPAGREIGYNRPHLRPSHSGHDSGRASSVVPPGRRPAPPRSIAITATRAHTRPSTRAAREHRARLRVPRPLIDPRRHRAMKRLRPQPAPFAGPHGPRRKGAQRNASAASGKDAAPCGRCGASYRLALVQGDPCSRYPLGEAGRANAWIKPPNPDRLAGNEPELGRAGKAVVVVPPRPC